MEQQKQPITTTPRLTVHTAGAAAQMSDASGKVLASSAGMRLSATAPDDESRASGGVIALPAGDGEGEVVACAGAGVRSVLGAGATSSAAVSLAASCASSAAGSSLERGGARSSAVTSVKAGESAAGAAASTTASGCGCSTAKKKKKKSAGSEKKSTMNAINGQQHACRRTSRLCCRHVS
jgi:hypothetical protein